MNSKLANSPEIVNQDPHDGAWLIKVRLTDRSETESLMTADQYEAYLAGGGKA